MEARVNQMRKDIASTLEDLKSIVAPVRESQERMWWAIDSMSKEVEELVQRDAGTYGREDTKLMPTNVNPAEEEPTPTTESSIPHYPIL